MQDICDAKGNSDNGGCSTNLDQLGDVKKINRLMTPYNMQISLIPLGASRPEGEAEETSDGVSVIRSIYNLIVNQRIGQFDRWVL